jgi:antitoxin YefM
MRALSYTALRNTLAKTMEKVCIDHEPIIITRKSEAAVVMLSLEDYESLEETTYLLRSPKNLKRLVESISQLDEAKGVEKVLQE